MAKGKSSLVPIRGSVEDWGPGKQQRNLDAKEVYARRMQEQVIRGSPDFARLLSLGVTPSEESGRRRAKPRKKTAAGKPARKKSKKKAVKGRR